MKKFLAFLLIAVIACTAVEDLDFEGFWGSVWSGIKTAWNWLGDHGVLGAVAGLCPGWVGPVCQAAAGYRF